MLMIASVLCAWRGAVAATTSVVEFNGTQSVLLNPMRGFRLETTLGDGPNNQTEVAAEVAVAKAHNVTVINTYTYFDGKYASMPLDEEKLRWIERDLSTLEQHSLSAVMVFSYLRGKQTKPLFNLPTVLTHLKQLAPLFKRYEGVIAAVISSFCGRYGEWSTVDCTPSVENTILLEQHNTILPPHVPLLVRKPKYKRQLFIDSTADPPVEPVAGPLRLVGSANAHDGSVEARVGHWNAKFAPGLAENSWPTPPSCAPGTECEPSALFDYVTREAPFVFLDGEMYAHDKTGNVSAMNATLRMRTHSFSTFSLTHSNSAFEPDGHVIDLWKKSALDETSATLYRLPISRGYFNRSSGVRPSHFDFMRDHLGYRYELQRLRTTSTTKTHDADRGVSVSLDLINRGFDVVHRPCSVELILLDPTDRAVVATATVASADPRAWQPYAPGDPTRAPLTHTLNATLRLGFLRATGEGKGEAAARATRTLDLGLRITILSGLGTPLAQPLFVCVANDLPWDAEAGVNTLGQISL
jgi:hypothetical protein